MSLLTLIQNLIIKIDTYLKYKALLSNVQTNSNNDSKQIFRSFFAIIFSEGQGLLKNHCAPNNKRDRAQS